MEKLIVGGVEFEMAETKAVFLAGTGAIIPYDGEAGAYELADNRQFSKQEVEYLLTMGEDVEIPGDVANV